MARASKNFLLWFFLGFTLLVVCFIRMRLASMPLERDEGEYAYMAQQMLQGVPPYTEAYAMKFPGIYAAYTMILSVFGQTDVGIRMGLTILNIATTIVIFLLARRLAGFESTNELETRNTKPESLPFAIWSAATYAVTSLAPSVLGLTANAEHFVLLPALLGVLVILHARNWKHYFLAGICLGLAVTIKQQGTIFAIVGLVWVISISSFKKSKITDGFLICLIGLLLPLALMVFWMWTVGALFQFYFWCFDYAKYYGSMWTWSDGWEHFKFTFVPVLKDHPLIFLIAIIGLLLSWRGSRKQFIFIASVVVVGFLAITPGLIFRPHYYLFILPGLSLAAGFGLAKLQEMVCSSYSSLKTLYSIIPGIFVLLTTFAMHFQMFFLADSENVSHQLYPNNAFPETRQIGQWLQTVTKPGEVIGILGSEPQIYFYAQRHAATPYLYLYPLFELQPFAASMQKDLIHIFERSPPRYLIHVRLPTSWLAGDPYSDSTVIEWQTNFLKTNYIKMWSIQIPEVPGEKGSRAIVIYLRKSK